MKHNNKLYIYLLTLVLSVILISTSHAKPSVLQTQYGPNETEIDLLKAKVVGKVLSVAVRIRNPGEKSTYIKFNIKDVHIIDNVFNKKYHVLKDEKGVYISGPVTSFTNKHISKGGSMLLWFKFPAPPATAKTIQLNIPLFTPFDVVEVQR